jgi:hypothetical protein
LIHNLLVALDKSQRRRLVLVLAGTLVGSMIEMIGIGSIPAYVGLLVDLVCFVYLVDFVHLVSFVQPKNQTNQMNKIDCRTFSASC